jgi:hypothetical protein
MGPSGEMKGHQGKSKLEEESAKGKKWLIASPRTSSDFHLM